MSGTERPRALITPASTQAGAAIGKILLSEGWNLLLHDDAPGAATQALIRSLAPVQPAARVEAAPPHLSRDGAAKTSFAQWASDGQPVSGLVLFANALARDSILTADRAALDLHLDANLRRPFALSQALAHHLPQGHTGTIVFISDLPLGRPDAEPFSALLSLQALESLARLLAIALAPRIRVNVLAPGPVLPAIGGTRAAPSPEVLGDALRYILRAPAVTGQTIALDGA